MKLELETCSQKSATEISTGASLKSGNEPPPPPLGEQMAGRSTPWRKHKGGTEWHYEIQCESPQ